MPRGPRPSTRISIHAPAWGATVLLMLDASPVIFQSTLPHGERPARRPRRGRDRLISIHAPAWGATGFAVAFWFAADLISIHAPAWGATRGIPDPGRQQHISIHAPAWGATGSRAARSSCSRYFNPRSRMGSDEHKPREILLDDHFNPRSRMGSDWPKLRAAGVMADFNPRSRMGSDPDRRRRQTDHGISIHAPAWGATQLHPSA